MSLQLQPVRIATGSNDEEGQLVFQGSHLVAILVQLADQHEDEAGAWFLEASFGLVAHPNPPLFADLDEAQAWIEQQLAGTPAHA